MSKDSLHIDTSSLLSLERMQQYLSGELNEQEVKEMEAAMAENPLLADALEGLGMVEDKAHMEAAIGRIKTGSRKRLIEKYNKRESLKRRRSRVGPRNFTTMVIAAAAAVTLLITSVFLIREMGTGTQDAEMAASEPIEQVDAEIKDAFPSAVPSVGDTMIAENASKGIAPADMVERKRETNQPESTAIAQNLLEEEEVKEKAEGSYDDLSDDFVAQPSKELDEITTPSSPQNQGGINVEVSKELVAAGFSDAELAQTDSVTIPTIANSPSTTAPIPQGSVSESAVASGRTRVDLELESTQSRTGNSVDQTRYKDIRKPRIAQAEKPIPVPKPSKTQISNSTEPVMAPEEVAAIPLDDKVVVGKTEMERKQEKTKKRASSVTTSPALRDEGYELSEGSDFDQAFGKQNMQEYVSLKLSAAIREHEATRFENSLDSLSEVFIAQPTNLVANYYAGSNYAKLNKPTEAVYHFQIATKSPERERYEEWYAKAQWELAQLYIQEGRIRAAKKRLRRIIEEKSPFAEEAQNLLKTLNK